MVGETPSTSSYQWMNDSFYNKIENITKEKFWFEVYGRNAPSAEQAEKLLWRIREELNIVRNGIVEQLKEREMRIQPLCVFISKFLNELTHTLCKFEARYFPIEWVLPEDCCVPHEFSKDAPEGKHTMIVSIRMQPLSDVLQDPDSSTIARHLSEMPDRKSQKSAYLSANRFFRKFVNDAVEHLYGYNIKWIFENDLPESQPVLEQRRELHHDLYVRFFDGRNENKRKIDSLDIETEGAENEKRIRRLEDVPETTPMKPQNSLGGTKNPSSVNEVRSQRNRESENLKFRMASYFVENPEKINEISQILAKVGKNREKLTESVASISGPSDGCNEEGHVHQTSTCSLINQETVKISQLGSVTYKSRPRDSLDGHRSKNKVERIGQLIKETNTILNSNEPITHDASLLMDSKRLSTDSCLTSSLSSRSEHATDKINERHTLHSSRDEPAMTLISNILTVKTDTEDKLLHTRYTPPSSSPRLNIGDNSTKASPTSKTMLSTPLAWSPGFEEEKSVDARIKDAVRDLELIDNETYLDISLNSCQEKNEEMDGCPLLESDDSDQENCAFVGYSESHSSPTHTQVQDLNISQIEKEGEKHKVHLSSVTIEESVEVVMKNSSFLSGKNNSGKVEESIREITKPEEKHSPEGSIARKPTKASSTAQQKPRLNQCSATPKKEEKQSKSTSTSTVQPLQNESSPPIVTMTFAKKKLSPLVATGFGFGYEEVTLKTLHRLPKYIQLMSRMKASEHRKYWFDQTIERYELFPNYGGHWISEGTKKVMDSVFRQLKSNQPTIAPGTEPSFSGFFSTNREEPVDFHQLKKFVKSNVKNRFRLDSGQFKYYIPNHWIDHLCELVSGQSSSFNFIDSPYGEDDCALWYISKHFEPNVKKEIKKRNFDLCTKLVFDLIRTVLVLKIDENGDHHLFFDGTLHIETPRSYSNSTSSSPAESY